MTRFRFALKAGVLMFNVESEDEMKEIDRVAGLMKVRPRCAQINPDIDPQTHP